MLGRALRRCKEAVRRTAGVGIAPFSLALVLVLGAAAAAAQDGWFLTLREARVLDVPALLSAPPDKLSATPILLPDDWLALPGGAGAGAGPQVRWYRIEFDAPKLPVDTPMAVFIPRVCSSFELYLDGELLHRAGELTEPLTRNCYHAQLVTLPAKLLQPSGNRIDLQVVGYALPRVAGRQRAGGLSTLVVGPWNELAAAQQRQLFWNVTLTQIVAAVLLLIGAVLGALAWVRRVPHLGWFAALCIGWAALTVRIWWREIPLSNGTLELASAIGFVPLAACAILFLWRYCGVRHKLLDRLLLLQTLALPMLLGWVGADRLFPTAVIVYALLALEVFASTGFFLAHAWKARRQEFWLLATVLGLMMLAVGIELGVQDRLLNLPSLHLVHLVMPALFCVMAYKLVESFGRALTAAENARHLLEQRVREVSAEIERNFAQLAESRVEQVAEKERKRIAADLHDDLGAKLLTIVHTSGDDRISTLAREALEEMRLSVRGIAGKPVQLADAMADWRAETITRLGETGIEIEWNSPDLVEPRTLAARSYVQTTRILREATSNLIKHSGASRAVVTCRIGEDFQLVIRDNGRGIPTELDGKLDRGHGMASMKQRAKSMHGQCLVESGPGYGTVIRLTLPL
ncbi:MAG TPA: ATP-binding protein [Methylibium sp.]|uniref:sensor histidine kinase n=1 Tax=Methylibium sp. TaxID=2067992 RepID=UPI002DBBC23D|nr:ATP-binding protein [Methylibium sp.]HEU4457902.1 ATP-binding protein [Methylibium sp.]